MSSFSLELDRFALSQSLNLHTSIVRSVDCAESLLLTSGLDTFTYLYNLENERYGLVQAYQQHQGPVYVTRFSSDPSYFFSGGGDAKAIRSDLEGNKCGEFAGHEGAVCSLDSSPQVLITGAWDATARLWDLNTQQCLATLPATYHSHAVSVLSTPDGYLTGSQNGKLNFWTLQGNHIRSVQAHSDIIREIRSVPGVGFATCSNDKEVKVWTPDGRLVQTLSGHEGYVFCLAVGPGPTLYSGSDDRTVKVWTNGLCTETYQFPNSVWSLAINSLTDLVTACGDKEVRVFTKSHLRMAAIGELEAFQKQCDEGLMAQSPDNINLAKLPKLEELNRIQGKKDGAYQIFNENGQGMVYCWHSEGEYWEKIGEVAGPAPPSSVKVYEGDEVFPQGEYDYIFDVEFGDGINRKLPYSNHQNPLEVAEKFCVRESLHKEFIFQIQAFINKNAQPGVNKAASVAKTEVQAKYFPYISYLLFDSNAMEPISKKIVELNGSLQPPAALDISEIEQLGKLCATLSQKSSYRSSTITRKDFLVINKLIKWPGSHLFPVLDLLRVVELHPNSVELFKGSEQGANVISPAMAVLAQGSGPALVTALRFLCNLFNDNTALYAVQKRREAILEAALTHIEAENKPLRLSLATLLLNFSVLFSSKEDAEGRVQILSAVIEFLNRETEEETMFRGLVTVGNLLCGGGIQSQLVEMAIQLGLGDMLNAKRAIATGKAAAIIQEMKTTFRL